MGDCQWTIAECRVPVADFIDLLFSIGIWHLAFGNYCKSSSLVHWAVFVNEQALFGFWQTKNFVIG